MIWEFGVSEICDMILGSKKKMYSRYSTQKCQLNEIHLSFKYGVN